MENIIWKDDYKIGVDFIDKEHKLLFSTMDKLLKISKTNKAKSEWACQEGVKYLKNHTVEHFEHEEEYMRSINYTEYEIHKRLHDNFRYKTLPALEEEMAEAEYSIESVRHFLGVCIGWVVAHTQTEDQAISGKTISKWVDIPHEKEKDALEQSIIQLIDEIFHLNAKLISEQYSGEDFGKIVCCRLIYLGQNKEKLLTTQCRQCDYLFACHGECPRNRFSISVDGQKGHNYLCQGYYRFFKHVSRYMDYMKYQLQHEQAPANIMEWIKSGEPEYRH